MSIVVQIEDLRVVYAPKTPLERHALRGVSLTVREGEFRAIIGPQGSGKSTLLQVMAGLMQGEGKVIVVGKDISVKKERINIWRRVGVVFQYAERQLFEDTVFNDVAFGPKNMGFSEEEIERRAREALRLVEIKEPLHLVSPYKLSGGQQRRVAIAGILAMEPDLLLLDEPTAGLDPRGRQQLMDLFAKLCAIHKITVVLVTHDMEEVAHRAQQVTVLHKGRVYLEGSPREIFLKDQELTSIGMSVPFARELAVSLNGQGIRVRPDITTLCEAEKEVVKLLNNSQSKC